MSNPPIAEYPCDFYMAGGHSIGRTSLCIYLSFFGVGTTVGEFWKGHRERRKTNTIDFIEKYRRLGKKTGLAVDCLMWDYPGEKLLGWKAPVIWLVRDPILLFTSFINAYVSGRVSDAFYGKVALTPIFELKQLCRLTLDHPAEFYQHYKLLKCILHPTAVEVVDTEDTLADKVEETLTRLLDFLKIDHSDLPRHREKLKISYISLRNRLRTLPGVTLYSPEGSLTVFPTRREMLPNTAYWYISNYYSLATLTHEGDPYEMVYFAPEPLPEPEKYATAENLDRLAHYLKQGLKLADFMEKYCRPRMYSPEAVAEAIKKNPDMHRKFMHFWDNDWVKVDEYSPAHTKRWEYARLVAG